MSDSLVRQSTFKTFDGQVCQTNSHQRPDRYSHLEQVDPEVHRIARGRGYSYSAASFGSDSLVQDMSLFNRFLHFDEGASTLTLEPGVTLQALMVWAASKNLYFPVMPGYPLITVGGCVAVDAHGKNPAKDGTFKDWVQALTVLHPNRGEQECSAGTNAQLFELTCGGFGLTGVITRITLKLVPLPGRGFSMRQTHTANFAEALDMLASDDPEIAYSWHDLCAGSGFGRGIVNTGQWSLNDSAGGATSGVPTLQSPRYRTMTSASRARLPISLWNRYTSRMANEALIFLSKRKSSESQVDCFAASFPFAGNPYFHCFFGSGGFREIQILIPKDGATAFLSALEFLVQATQAPTMMGSIKAFRGSAQALSMSGEGYVVTVVCYTSAKLSSFLQSVDALMVEHGGQPNLSKDSRLSQAMAEATLPHFESFKERLFAYDEKRLLRSELSGRLGLL